MKKDKNSKKHSKKNLIRIPLKSLEESITTEEDETIENKEDRNSHKTCTRCKKDFHSECFFGKSQSPIKKSASLLKKNNANNTNKKNNCKNLNSANKHNEKLQSKNICCFCEDKIKKDTESMKISDFFKPKKNQNLTSSAYKAKAYKNGTEKTELSAFLQSSLQNDIVMFDFEEKKNENVAHYPKFVLWKPLPQEKIELLKENLKNALIFKNIEFSDDLAFLDAECAENMNNAKLEPGIQKMSSYNKGVFYKFKERTRLGEYPGLEIIEDPIQVFIYLFKLLFF